MSVSVTARNIFSSNAAEAGTDVHSGMTRNKAPAVFAVALALWLLAVVIVCIRLYSRRILTKFYGADDTLILAALLFSTGDFTLKMIWCFSGLGIHLQRVSTTDLARFAKVAFSIAVLYPWSLGFAKISILVFYRRIFPSQRFRKVCLGGIVFVATMILGVSLAQLLSCVPISNSYSLVQKPGGYCVNKAALQYAGNGLNLGTDLAILLMPMKYLWALAVDTRKRVGIILLFSSGLITVIASILRLRTIYKFYNSKDLTYNAYPIAIWSAVEINLTIATASVAASKPFMDKIIMKRLKKRWPNMFTLTTASESSSGRSLQSTSKVMISHNARGSSIIPDPPPSSGMSTTIPEIHTPSTLHSVPPEDKDSHSNAGFNWNNKNNHGVEDVATTTAADDDDDDDMEFDDYNNTLRAISSPAGASSTRGSQSRQRNGQMTMTEILKESRMPSTENIHKMSSRTTNDNVFWLKGDGSLKADKGDRETG